MKPLPFTRPGEAGFTLVEVLIALTIVSVALAAFVRMTSQTTSNYEGIEQRTLAMMAAENMLAERRLSQRAPVGIELADCPQGRQKFVCRMRSEASQQGLRTVTVAVYASRGEASPLLSLQTRLAEPTL